MVSGTETKIFSLSSGDQLFKVMVGDLDETPFVISDDGGQKVGVNKLAFRRYCIDNSDNLTYRLFPVVIDDLIGQEAVNASGLHGLVDFDQGLAWLFTLLGLLIFSVIC